MFTEDPRVFQGEFYEPAQRQDGTEFQVLFERAYVDPLGVASTAPRISYWHADAADLRGGHLVTVRGVQYEVQAPEPDGTGWAAARLQKA